MNHGEAVKRVEDTPEPEQLSQHSTLNTQHSTQLLCGSGLLLINKQERSSRVLAKLVPCAFPTT